MLAKQQLKVCQQRDLIPPCQPNPARGFKPTIESVWLFSEMISRLGSSLFYEVVPVCKDALYSISLSLPPPPNQTTHHHQPHNHHRTRRAHNP